MPNQTTRTDEEIAAEANELTRRLMAADGYAVTAGHLLFLDPSPRAQHYWDLAALAYDHLRATDINDTLANLGIERPDEKALLPGMRALPARARQRRR